MPGFPKRSEEEILRINRLQAEYFGEITHFFDPPLPEGVPGRLKRIVDAAGIEPGDRVLDVGTGTGILIPLIQARAPAEILANDLSKPMLDSVNEKYPSVRTIRGAVRGVDLPSGTIDVVFVNACYANIIDKHGTFTNLARMIRPGGRLVISHPMGRSFIDMLKPRVPFPLDEFPVDENEVEDLFSPYGFRQTFLEDEEDLYILRLERMA